MLSALDGSPALSILEKRKIGGIALTRNIPKTWNGYYDHNTGDLRVNTVRRGGEHYGDEFVPGISSRMSRATDDKFESMRRVFLHEVAHHVQRIGGDEVAGITDAAFASPRRRSITDYGDTAPEEYFAETWVAYHVIKGTLQSFDPVGYKMVEDVLEARKRILR